MPPDGGNDLVNIPLAHLGVKGQTNALVTRRLAQGKPLRTKTLGIAGFPVDRHDAAARGNALVEQALHETIPDGGGGALEPDQVGLLVPPGLGRLGEERDPRGASEGIIVALGDGPPAHDHALQPAQLGQADGGLDIGEPVVVAQDGVFLGDHRLGLMALPVVDGHAVLAEQAKLPMGWPR